VKTGLVVLGVVALAIILALGWFVSVGNGLVARELGVREAWAQVQNVYQRRADLVPNLVEVVRGFAAQERAVLEEVTRARASVAGIQVTPEVLRDPEALRKFQDAQAALGGALGRLLAVVERYPDLKSNQNFLALQSQLEGTENRIAVERRRYNEAVREYNTSVSRFPGNLVASLRGFSARRYFEASPGADTPPAIKF
jgi:LemA protein